MWMIELSVVEQIALSPSGFVDAQVPSVVRHLGDSALKRAIVPWQGWRAHQVVVSAMKGPLKLEPGHRSICFSCIDEQYVTASLVSDYLRVARLCGKFGSCTSQVSHLRKCPRSQHCAGVLAGGGHDNIRWLADGRRVPF